MISSAGTLVVAAPSKDGLVISADSLSTIDGGRAVPSRPKLKSVPGVAGTVFTITGVGTFLPVPPRGTNAIQWFQKAQPTFSIEPLVGAGLAANGDCALDLPALSAIADNAATLLSAYLISDKPIDLPSPKRVCDIFIFRYDAVTKGATRFRCVLVALPDSSVRVLEHSLKYFAETEDFSYWTAGETEYADTHVFAKGSIGKPMLTSLLAAKFVSAGVKIANVTGPEAALFCESVIRATEFATKTIRAPSAIGGAPLTWLVTGSQAPHPIAAK